jgi:hypothetical protein
VARSMSSTNLGGAEQQMGRAEWRMDLPPASTSAAEDEALKKQIQRSLAPRPRRVATLTRPPRPYSSRLLLACAAAILMLAAACYCRYSSSGGPEPRHVSLMEVSAPQAHSPATP